MVGAFAAQDCASALGMVALGFGQRSGLPTFGSCFGCRPWLRVRDFFMEAGGS